MKQQVVPKPETGFHWHAVSNLILIMITFICAWARMIVWTKFTRRTCPNQLWEKWLKRRLTMMMWKRSNRLLCSSKRTFKPTSPTKLLRSLVMLPLHLPSRLRQRVQLRQFLLIFYSHRLHVSHLEMNQAVLPCCNGQAVQSMLLADGFCCSALFIGYCSCWCWNACTHYGYRRLPAANIQMVWSTDSLDSSKNRNYSIYRLNQKILNCAHLQHRWQVTLPASSLVTRQNHQPNTQYNRRRWQIIIIIIIILKSMAKFWETNIENLVL